MRRRVGQAAVALLVALAACTSEDADRAPTSERPALRDGPARTAAQASDRADTAPEPEAEPAAVRRRVNEAGLRIIEDSEGLSLEAYQLAGQWLIGYGHAGTAEPGMTVTEDEAEALLREDLRATEEAIERLVEVPLNDNQFSALVSLVYNLGPAGFQKTLAFERLQGGDYEGAADAFLYLDSARIDGEMRELPALKERRERERALFLAPVEEDGAAAAADGR